METRKISELEKIDSALKPQALNNSNVTSRYFQMTGFGKVLAFLFVAAMAATTTAILEILQAKDASGTDAKSLKTVTLTANTKVIAATIALASVANTDVVTVNGVSFTKAAATDTATKAFADAAGLVLCINAWCQGVIASASSTTVTVQSVNGEADVTVAKTEVAGTITLATTEGQAVLEAQVQDFDLDDGFTYFAIKITTTANSVVQAGLIRKTGHFLPSQIGPSAAA